MLLFDFMNIADAYRRQCESVVESLTIPENPVDAVEMKLRETLKKDRFAMENGDRLIRWFRFDRKRGMADGELEKEYISNLDNLLDLLKTYDTYVSSIKASGKPLVAEVTRGDGRKAKLDAVTGLDYIKNPEIAKEFVKSIGDQILSSGRTLTAKSSYAIRDSDLKNIKLIGSTENVMCWETATYESTNKFVYQLWQNAETLGRGDVYGNPTEQTPYCTHSIEHWENYSEDFGEELYRQYWFLEKMDDGLDYTPGDLSKPNVSKLFNLMRGKGPELLIAMNDSGGDMLDRNDNALETEGKIKALEDFGGEVWKLNSTVVDEGIGRTVDEVTKPINDFIEKGIANGESPKQLLMRAQSDFAEKFKMLRTFKFPEGIGFVGAKMFEGCKNLRRIELPSDIESIGDYAFYDCFSLAEVKLPDGLKRIGEMAFANCSSLMSIQLPQSLEIIERHAFSGSGLVDFTIPDNVNVNVSTQCCSHCYNLKSVSIGNGTRVIQPNAFYQCSYLKSVKLGNNVISIRNGAFDGCGDLVDISMGDNVAIIEAYAFNRCYSMKLRKLPAKLEKIEAGAFGYCKAMGPEIRIPDGVEKVGSGAFYDCIGIVSIMIPDALFRRAYVRGLLSECEGIKKVYIPESTFKWLSERGNDATTILEYLGLYPLNGVPELLLEKGK